MVGSPLPLPQRPTVPCQPCPPGKYHMRGHQWVPAWVGTGWAGTGTGLPLSSSLCQVAWPALAGAALPTRWWLPMRCPTSLTSTSSWGARSSSLVPRRCLQVRQTWLQALGWLRVQARTLATWPLCWNSWSCGWHSCRATVGCHYWGAAEGNGVLGTPTPCVGGADLIPEWVPAR